MNVAAHAKSEAQCDLVRRADKVSGPAEVDWRHPIRPFICLAMLVPALVAVPAASTAPVSVKMALGIFDDAQTLQHPARTFARLQQLHVQVARITLDWSEIASSKPTAAGDPGDPAYNWKLYDKAVQQATKHGIRVLFTVWGTPAWANDGQPPRYPPIHMQSLFNFTFAAATRYDGAYVRRGGATLPQVGLWLAWNEPNDPGSLMPQYTRAHGKWVMAAPAAYAKICSSVYQAVHAAQEQTKVACGATAPRGDDSPESRRPSISPLTFLRGVKAAGLQEFDAWAHHPYYRTRADTPSTRPPALERAVELGNLGTLISELTRLYGQRRVWITQYGFQTSPPDRLLGVSWAKQASFVRQSYLIARANPRVDLFTWYLLDDAPNVATGWQSGLLTASGRSKPALRVLRQLPH
jgi:hypothetical protein